MSCEYFSHQMLNNTAFTWKLPMLFVWICHFSGLWVSGGGLTLAELCFWNSLPDDATGIVHHGGGLKLHGLHHIPHPDLQRQRHHDWHYRTLLLLQNTRDSTQTLNTLFSLTLSVIFRLSNVHFLKYHRSLVHTVQQQSN